MPSPARPLLGGQDAFGDPVTWTPVRLTPFELPGSGLVTRRAVLDTGTEVLLRTPGRLRPEAERLLDREIRACVRVARRYAAEAGLDGVPLGLVQLRAYDVDGVEPFAAVTPYRGVPARQAVPRLIGRKPQVLAANLLAALDRLSVVDLVHGNLTPDTVFVDGLDEPGGPRVQIVTFEHTLGVGERRADGRNAHPGDDVLAVGQLLAVAFADVPPGAAPEPYLATVGWLRDALEGVFDPDPGARPTAREVLRRLPVASTTGPRDPAESGLEAGRQRFDRWRGPSPSGPGTEDAPSPPVTEPARVDRSPRVAPPAAPVVRTPDPVRRSATPAVVAVLVLAALVLIVAVVLAGAR